MPSQLLLQLFASTLSVVGTVLLHLAGLTVLILLMRAHHLRFVKFSRRIDQAIILTGVALGVFVLHTIEIWLYAGIYLLLPTGLAFEEALYFSTVTYASVGYGDITLPKDWRLFGAIEGANGIILLGWSTAFFVSVVSRLRALEHDWLRD